MLNVLLPFLALSSVGAVPLQVVERNNDIKSYYDLWDLQAHRGGRGEYVESTLPAFAIGLKDGVTSLEFDCGLTKDGAVIVWHDEIIDATKCRDTGPVFDGDEIYPYVGKNVANLTLAQIKTLDCGSLRIDGFPFSEVQPGTKLSTLDEVFDFVECATDAPVLFNIESKVNPVMRNQTRSAAEFVAAMAKVFLGRGGDVVERITHQSFDWEALIISKSDYPTLRTSALCDSTTLYYNSSLTPAGPGDWLGGINIDDFEGQTIAERVVRAAHSIGADYISPTMTSGETPVDIVDPSQEGWIGFVNQTMVDVAHELGMGVKPWTANRKNMLEYILAIGVDGVITDYPHEFRETLERFHPDRRIAPKGDEERVRGCLRKHIQLTGMDLPNKGYGTSE